MDGWMEPNDEGLVGKVIIIRSQLNTKEYESFLITQQLIYHCLDSRSIIIIIIIFHQSSFFLSLNFPNFPTYQKPNHIFPSKLGDSLLV